MSLRVYAESYDVACSTGGKMLLTFHGNASMQRGGVCVNACIQFLRYDT